MNSQIYNKKIDDLNLDIALTSLPAPLLVALIEEGFADHNILDQTLASYLSHPTLANIDALLLACTHYPVIKNLITLSFLLNQNLYY